MNGKVSILVSLTFLVCLAPAGFAQTTQPDSNLGGQLIAWSELQNPQPMPQPRPDPAPIPEEQQPDRQQPDRQQPDRQQPGQPVNADAQAQSSAQTVTGTIVKEDGKYVLKASDGKTYQVDDQEKAKHFEGKQVKIVGTLDSSNILRIQSIEPAS
jgi:Protein of unknown function (DUF5818)